MIIKVLDGNAGNGGIAIGVDSAAEGTSGNDNGNGQQLMAVILSKAVLMQ